MKFLSLLFLATSCYAADTSGLKYRLEKGGAPPPDVAATLRDAVAPASVKVVNASGEASLEFWFVEQKLAPADADKEESGATLGRIKHGSMVGLVRVAKNVNDRRGDRIAPGVYVLRLSFHPVDGAHQGVAPQRDFLVLTNAASDTDPRQTPAFALLMQSAQQAAGNSHPLSLACWLQDQDFSPGLHAAGENDTVLHVRIGDVPLVIIIAGRYEG